MVAMSWKSAGAVPSTVRTKDRWIRAPLLGELGSIQFNEICPAPPVAVKPVKGSFEFETVGLG